MLAPSARRWALASAACLMLLAAGALAVRAHRALTETAEAAAPPANARAATAWDDRFGDGTPDFQRLDTPSDRHAFRRWFTDIAEYQALRADGALPIEVSDCSALLRYAYRNALRKHDLAWMQETGLGRLGSGSVEKYSYPFTPLGANLFRVKARPLRPDEAGAFAEFADAFTLKERNTFLVGRDLGQARSGDLLFYRQLGHSPAQAYHSMVFVGQSRLMPEGEAVVVYHTGPDSAINHGKGEMRRATVGELQKHPDARWRPVEGNPNFLGVYRWNILRESY